MIYLNRDRKTKELKVTDGLKSRVPNQKWRIYELNEKIIGDSSYLKFGSPEYVSAEHIYNVGKEIYKNSDFPNFNEVRICSG